MEDPVAQQLITKVRLKDVLAQFKPRVGSVKVELWSFQPIHPELGLPGLLGGRPGVRESSGVDLLKASLTPETLGEQTAHKTRSSSILGTASMAGKVLASGAKLMGLSSGRGGGYVRDVVLSGPSIPLLPLPRAGGRRRKRSGRREYSEIVYPRAVLPL